MNLFRLNFIPLLVALCAEIVIYFMFGFTILIWINVALDHSAASTQDEFSDCKFCESSFHLKLMFGLINFVTLQCISFLSKWKISPHAHLAKLFNIYDPLLPRKNIWLLWLFIIFFSEGRRKSEPARLRDISFLVPPALTCLSSSVLVHQVFRWKNWFVSSRLFLHRFLENGCVKRRASRKMELEKLFCKNRNGNNQSEYWF